MALGQYYFLLLPFPATRANMLRQHAKLSASKQLTLRYSRAPAFGDEAHMHTDSDVWDPSFGGHKNYVTFTDDLTLYTLLDHLR